MVKDAGDITNPCLNRVSNPLDKEITSKLNYVIFKEVLKLLTNFIAK